MNRPEAMVRTLAFGVAVAVLNKIGFQKIFKPGKHGKKTIWEALGAGWTEMWTEYGEEPAGYIAEHTERPGQLLEPRAFAKAKESLREFRVPLTDLRPLMNVFEEEDIELTEYGKGFWKAMHDGTEVLVPSFLLGFVGGGSVSQNAGQRIIDELPDNPTQEDLADATEDVVAPDLGDAIDELIEREGDPTGTPRERLERIGFEEDEIDAFMRDLEERGRSPEEIEEEIGREIVMRMKVRLETREKRKRASQLAREARESARARGEAIEDRGGVVTPEQEEKRQRAMRALRYKAKASPDSKIVEPKTAEGRKAVELAERLGLDLVYSDDTGDAGGLTHFEDKRPTGVIIVNSKYEGTAMWQVVGHEITHGTRIDAKDIGLSKEELGALSRRYMDGDLSLGIESVSEDYRKRLLADPELMHAEAVSQYVEDLFGKKEFRDKVLKILEDEPSSVVEKLAAWIERVAETLGMTLSKSERGVLREIRRIAAKNAAKETRGQRPAEKAAPTSEDVRFARAREGEVGVEGAAPGTPPMIPPQPKANGLYDRKELYTVVLPENWPASILNVVPKKLSETGQYILLIRSSEFPVEGFIAEQSYREDVVFNQRERGHLLQVSGERLQSMAAWALQPGQIRNQSLQSLPLQESQTEVEEELKYIQAAKTPEIAKDMFLGVIEFGVAQEDALPEGTWVGDGLIELLESFESTFDLTPAEGVPSEPRYEPTYFNPFREVSEIPVKVIDLSQFRRRQAFGIELENVLWKVPQHDAVLVSEGGGSLASMLTPLGSRLNRMRETRLDPPSEITTSEDVRFARARDVKVAPTAKGKGVTPAKALVEGLSPEDVQLVRDAKIKVRTAKSKHPEALPLVIATDRDGRAKIKVETDPNTGAEKRSALFKTHPYRLHKPPLSAGKTEAEVVEKYAQDAAKEVSTYLNRPDIAAAKGWYGRMRKFLQRNFGANIEIFGQLLGATSARTGVEDNFRQSVEALEEYSRGTYDDLLDRFDVYVQSIYGKGEDTLFAEWKEHYADALAKKSKRESEFDAEKERVRQVNRWEALPVKRNGEKFNANSRPVLHVLYGIWLRQTQGPKTPNFAGNLTGRTLDPTIDVWAARFLRRLMFGHQQSWRFLPEQEKGVGFSKRKDGTISGEFPVAQKIFTRAAEILGFEADDFQAVAWFIEKDVWDKKGWTTKTGKKKSDFMQEAGLLAGRRIQAGVTTFTTSAKFNAKKHESTRKKLRRAISRVTTLMSARVTASEGMFEGSREPTFDVEVTLNRKKGNTDKDIQLIAESVLRAGRDNDQKDIFVSEVVEENHPNARPMVEIGFRSPLDPKRRAKDQAAIDAVIKAFTDQGIDGFTVAANAIGEVQGIRTQYVPEFSGGEHLDALTGISTVLGSGEMMLPLLLQIFHKM